MSEHIHTHSAKVRDPDGRMYVAHILGVERADGTWSGWLEFRPAEGESPALRTGQETSQPDRTALDYWAGGLERVYIEGALVRARVNARRGEGTGRREERSRQVGDLLDAPVTDRNP